MHASQEVQTVALESLQQQLRQFGLDPRDWLLEPLDRERWAISAHDDPEFRFVGVSDDGSRWREIRLASI